MFFREAITKVPGQRRTWGQILSLFRDLGLNLLVLHSAVLNQTYQVRINELNAIHNVKKSGSTRPNFSGDSVVLESMRANRLINESNTTGGLRKTWTGSQVLKGCFSYHTYDGTDKLLYQIGRLAFHSVPYQERLSGKSINF